MTSLNRDGEKKTTVIPSHHVQWVKEDLETGGYTVCIDTEILDLAYQRGKLDGRKDYWEKLEATRDLLFRQAYKLAKQSKENDALTK